ncbi:hypothetical protein KV113_24865 [Mycolicibacter sp. MYC340]|uniref:Uncharacterized protein n=1 Tax=[Mycobacterium] nativiensis TaxID=2855503 RepID=A0ABU5Y3T5_9MYCO|nr:hypothetical protein [Mycolicibacter sp. MYC340]MEB3034778.1 hypothetical protein [Mycolicibacter sp. MYC340]
MSASYPGGALVYNRASSADRHGLISGELVAIGSTVEQLGALPAGGIRQVWHVGQGGNQQPHRALVVNHRAAPPE